MVPESFCVSIQNTVKGRKRRRRKRERRRGRKGENETWNERRNKE